MSFKTESIIQDNVLILSLEGKVLEETVLKQLLSDLEQSIKAVKGKVIISIEKLDYINSTGINFFIKVLTKSRVLGGDLIIAGAQGSVQHIVVTSKMNEVFTMTETVEEALTLHKTTK
jgi:anti-sigma B factor antagonist